MSQNTALRPDIEGLRAIAVGVVIAFHAAVPFTPGGFVGVDVFFVVSGYLITRLLVAEASAGRLSLTQFYARRARRLLPAATAMVGLTALAGVFLYSPTEQQRFTRSALTAVTYVSNWRFLQQSRDYFAPETAEDPFLHTWSLAVEEQFYFIWPLIILFTYRYRARPTVVLGVIAATSFIACVAVTSFNAQWAFFAMPTRMWQFALGGLAAVTSVHSFEERYGVALSWAGATLIAVPVLLYSDHTSFPGVAAVLPTCGTVVLLRIGAIHPSSGVGRWLSARPLQIVGARSYSLYLWHWPVLVLGNVFVPRPSPVDRLTLGVLIGVLAALSYRYLENPIRFHPILAQRPRLTLAGAASLTAVSAVGCVVLTMFAARGTWSPAQRQIAQAARMKPAMEVPGCVATFTVAKPLECTFGDTASRRTVVLFGDSHASQWFPALDEIARAERWRLVTFVKSSCTTADVEIVNVRLRRPFSECSQWRRASMTRIQALKPDLVIVAGFTSSYANLLVDKHSDTARNYADLSAGLRRTLAQLSDARIETIMLQDFPKPGRDVPECLSRALYQGWDVVKECSIARNSPVEPPAVWAERTAVVNLPHVVLLDLTPHLCSADYCAPVKNDVVIYRDAHHLAVNYVRLLIPTLQEQLRRQLPGAAETSSSDGT